MNIPGPNLILQDPGMAYDVFFGTLHRFVGAFEQASRALNIHTFVKFDEFLMYLSPNLVIDRRNPYVVIVKFTQCRRILRFDP